TSVISSSSGGRGMSTRPDLSPEDRALGRGGISGRGPAAIIRFWAGAMMSAPVGGGRSEEADRVLDDGMSSSASRSYTGLEKVVDAP
ncbi:hypothetical protein PRIPAC_84570, partial [Pristionchus pacificus]|uniref:Uncharacterized protein n=1 Tax=Pristionchus pacificus TaxID=54126 RepID=A0A2A6BKP1_PRIPA